MMAGVRPIPRRMLRQDMVVQTPALNGQFNDAVVVRHVRYERNSCAYTDEEHRSADGGSGRIWVDAVNSRTAFDIPAGSRICIEGDDVFVVKSSRYFGTDGRIHHWELEVR